MINIYMKMEMMNHIMPMQFKDGIGHELMSDLTIEIIDDMPITGVVKYTEQGEEIAIFQRDDKMSRNSLYAAGGIENFKEDNSIKLEVGNGQIIALFHDLAWNINTALFNAGWLERAEELDPEEAGLELTMDEKGLHPEIVTGRERPDLLCVIENGSQLMVRPYKVDRMQKSKADMLPFAEKLAAAENGDEMMMEKVAFIYMNGDEETAADKAKAAYWFEQMAERKIPFAQFNLALLYAKGIGVEKDLNKAIYWMEKASENGDTDAAKIAQQLKAQIGPSVS